MSKRSDILDTLETELATITSTNGYNTDISEVKRGQFNFDDIINKPAICFYVEYPAGDTVDAEMFADTGSDQFRYLIINLYGYMDSGGYDDYEALHDLVYDIEYFLKYNFTYKNKTYVGPIGFIEKGLHCPNSFFELYIRVGYINNV